MKLHQFLFRTNPSWVPKTTNRVIIITALLLMLILIWLTRAEAARVIINGGFVVLSGGTSSTPVNLVIDTLSTAGITRNSGHIISEGEYNRVQWNVRTGTGTYTFPIGRTTATYIPFVFNKTTAGTESGTGTVRVSSWYTLNNAVWPTGTSLCGVATTEDDVVDRFWVIDVLNYSANPTATIRFNYADPDDIAGIPAEDDLQAQRWNSSLPNTCKWELPPTGTVDVVNNFVEVAGISDFSPWALVNKNNPLPIELLYFNAKWKDKKYTAVELEWETASEINNDYFEIQRSIDAVNFTLIKTVSGAGNSTQIIYYTEYDNEPFKETASYYRLKQVDYDGTFTYSNIEAINPPDGINLIIIYPNPSNEYIDYLVYSSKDATVSVWAVDAAGRLVISEKQELKKGVNKLRLNTSHLSGGSYILKIAADLLAGASAKAGENTKTEKQFIIQ